MGERLDRFPKTKIDLQASSYRFKALNSKPGARNFNFPMIRVIRFNDILEKVSRNFPGADLSLIEKAYVYSAKVHQGQVRLSGEPYLIHPLEVAAILADMKMDIATVTAGLLHDTVEDTYATFDEIKELFGPEIGFPGGRPHQDQQDDPGHP